MGPLPLPEQSPPTRFAHVPLDPNGPGDGSSFSFSTSEDLPMIDWKGVLFNETENIVDWIRYMFARCKGTQLQGILAEVTNLLAHYKPSESRQVSSWEVLKKTLLPSTLGEFFCIAWGDALHFRDIALHQVRASSYILVYLCAPDNLVELRLCSLARPC